MLRPVHRRRPINLVLELRQLVERALDDHARARAELRELERRLRLVTLYVGTADTYLETIRQLYNALAIELGEELDGPRRSRQGRT